MSTQRTQAEMEELRLNAKHLIEVEGMQQKQIAELLDVSERTLSDWVIKYRWQKNTPMLQKRKIAYRLVVVQGLEQKEAAQIIKVSEKTISAWAAKFKWKEARKRQETEGTQLQSFIRGVLRYAMLDEPKYYPKFEKVIKEFITSETKISVKPQIEEDSAI